MEKNSNIEKKFYTVSEFWMLLGCVVSRAYLYELIKCGEIKTSKIGGKMLIPVSWADQYIKEKTCVA